MALPLGNPGETWSRYYCCCCIQNRTDSRGCKLIWTYWSWKEHCYETADNGRQSIEVEDLPIVTLPKDNKAVLVGCKDILFSVSLQHPSYWLVVKKKSMKNSVYKFNSYNPKD